MNKTGGVFIALLLFIISACSMPETKIYSIFIPDEMSTAKDRVDESIVIQADSEDYLRQPYIAYRDSLYQVVISKYSKWESSPYKIIRKEFSDALSSAGLFSEVSISSVSRKSFYTLRIFLSRFERLDEDSQSYCVLEFKVDLLSPEGQELYSESISSKVAVESRDFKSLAEIMSASLKKEIEAIGTNIATLLLHSPKTAETGSTPGN